MPDNNLEIHLLGPFSVRYAGQPVASLHSLRHQSLLAYLLFHRSEPQPRRFLAYLFWPDSEEDQARTNFRKLLHDLRKALPDADQFLDASGQTIAWRQDAPYRLDVDDFERAIGQVHTVEDYQAVAGLYRGELLPNCYDDWILPERERLRQEYLNALEHLVKTLEGERQYSTAIAYAQQLLEHDPLREETYRQVMRLYALSGDPAGVLRTFRNCVSILQRELGVEPSLITREAYRRTLDLYETLSTLPPPPAQLVGRREEWTRLQELWSASLSGHAQMALISGPDGIGKTRLAEELVQWAAAQGAATAGTHCYAGDQELPLAPLAQWLRAHPLPQLDKLWLSEIARLLPEIQVRHPSLPAPGPIHEAWQRHRFFEAVTQALLAYQPIALLIDDLQWASAEVLEWLHYFLHFDPEARVMVIATLGTDEIQPGQPIHAVLPSLRRESQVDELALGGLDVAEIGQVAELYAGHELTAAVKEELYRVSGGNPFQVMKSIGADGAAEAEAGAEGRRTTGRGWEPLSQPVSGDPLRVHAPARAVPVTSSALDLSDPAVDHPGKEGQRRLHQQAAEALEAVYREGLLEVSAEIAMHYENAGMASQAVTYYLHAGSHALDGLAYAAALQYFGRALSLLPEGDEETVIDQIRMALSRVGIDLDAQSRGAKLGAPAGRGGPAD